MAARWGALGAVVLILVCGTVHAASFDIMMTFDFSRSGLDRQEQARVRTMIGRASDFWTRHITGYAVDDAHLRGIEVPVRLGSYGRNLLAFVTDRSTYAEPASNGVIYSALQPLTVNTDVLPFLRAHPRFALQVAIHELAHAVGFGPRWETNGLYENGSGRYLGAEGLDAYRSEFDPMADFVPVEVSTGHRGSDDLHWAEDWAGGRDATMTAYASLDAHLTDTTLLSLRDLGYTTLDTVTPAPVPVPAAGPMMAVVLALLAWIRRQRRGSCAG